MNAETTVDAGVCGFRTTVKASSADDQTVDFEVTTDCDKVRALAAKLRPIDAYMEIGLGHDGELMQAVRATLGGCCAGCVVPAAIFKTMQVAAKLALPRDVHLSMLKE